MRPLLDATAGIQINIKETGNYACKRLLDMTNVEINTLTQDR